MTVLDRLRSAQRYWPANNLIPLIHDAEKEIERYQLGIPTGETRLIVELASLIQFLETHIYSVSTLHILDARVKEAKQVLARATANG